MKKKIYYGWVCVGASFIMLFLYQINYTFGIFLEPLIDKYGWSRTSVSIANSITWAVAIPMGIVWGKIFDIYGPKVVFAASTFIGGSGLILSGFASELWQLYLFFGVIWGIGWSSFFCIANSLTRKWFNKKAGIALGIANCGIPLGWVALYPLVEYLIRNFSIKNAFIILGAAVWVSGIIITVIVKKSPEDIGLAPDGEPLQSSASGTAAAENTGNGEWDAKHAVINKNFWFVWVTKFFIVIVVSIISVHGVSLVVSQGVPRSTAAFIIGMMGLISVTGRLGSGLLGDFLIKKGMAAVHARRYMYTLSSLLMGIGIIILSRVHSPGMLWIWAVVFGVGYGIHVPQLAAITGDMFGRKNLGFIITLLGTCAGIAGIIGPILAGAIFDVTESYNIALLITGLVCLGAVIFSLLITTPKRKPAAEKKPAA